MFPQPLLSEHSFRLIPFHSIPIHSTPLDALTIFSFCIVSGFGPNGLLPPAGLLHDGTVAKHALTRRRPNRSGSGTFESRYRRYISSRYVSSFPPRIVCWDFGSRPLLRLGQVHVTVRFMRHFPVHWITPVSLIFPVERERLDWLALSAVPCHSYIFAGDTFALPDIFVPSLVSLLWWHGFGTTFKATRAKQHQPERVQCSALI